MAKSKMILKILKILNCRLKEFLYIEIVVAHRFLCCFIIIFYFFLSLTPFSFSLFSLSLSLSFFLSFFLSFCLSFFLSNSIKELFRVLVFQPPKRIRSLLFSQWILYLYLVLSSYFNSSFFLFPLSPSPMNKQSAKKQMNHSNEFTLFYCFFFFLFLL